MSSQLGMGETAELALAFGPASVAVPLPAAAELLVALGPESDGLPLAAARIPEDEPKDSEA